MTGYAPIVVFAYNRPKHLRQTLEYLARADGANRSDLWIFCDGPKESENTALVEAVRAVAGDSVWTEHFQVVHITVSNVNRGLAASIINGVSHVMDVAGRTIVIEDDLLVAPDFLRFMNECLEFYRDDQSVGSITGFSPLTRPPIGYPYQVMAVPRSSSQGWGTWADRWCEVDWEAKDARRIWHETALRRRFRSTGNDRVDRLRRQLDGTIDSWSIRFGLSQFISGYVTIYPVHNRILNIGYDGTGVHSGTGTPKNKHVDFSNIEMRPSRVDVDPRVLRAFRRIYSGPCFRSAIRNVKSWLLTRGT